MLGADVVVTQPQRLAEGQFQRLLRRRVERDESGRRAAGRGRQRRGRRRADGFRPRSQDLQDGDGQGLRVDEQPQDQVLGPDLVVAGPLGLVLRRHHDVARPRGEPPEALAGVEVGRLVRLLRGALLRGLLRHAHAPADLRPGRARAPGLVDEVADQVVGELTEAVGGDDRTGELFENVRMHLLDCLDQVVEPDRDTGSHRIRHASTID